MFWIPAYAGITGVGTENVKISSMITGPDAEDQGFFPAIYFIIWPMTMEMTSRAK